MVYLNFFEDTTKKLAYVPKLRDSYLITLVYLRGKGSTGHPGVLISRIVHPKVKTGNPAGRSSLVLKQAITIPVVG
jgi:hypothetical protein